MKRKIENEFVQQQNLQVTMLGEFLLTDGDKVELKDRVRSRKLWNLLEYLVLNHKGSVTSECLVEILCQQEKSSNPANAVKNIVYRLRKMLTEQGLPGEQCILFQNGAYCWNKNFLCHIDAEEFEIQYQKAEQEGISEEEKLNYYRNALKLYRGKLLNGCSAGEWSLPAVEHYHEIYVNCLRKTCRLLYTKENFEEVVSFCQKGTEIDPYNEEIYEIMIHALICLERQKEALIAYETILGRLFNDLGINPSNRLKSLYREIIKTIKNVETDLLVIKQDLDESGGKNGAYYCDYEVFKDSYRFVARMMERTGQSVYIMLCTLTDQDYNYPEVTRIKNIMEKLQNAIANSLRKGDIFARYSSTQYVIMLSGITYENSIKVGKRIDANFKKMFHTKNEVMHFKLTPLSPFL